MQSHRSEYSHSTITGEPPISPDSLSLAHNGEDDFVPRHRRRHTGGGHGRSRSRRGSASAGNGVLSEETSYDGRMERDGLVDDDDDDDDYENINARNRRRIEDYENALSPVKRSSSEYGFKVIPMPPGHVPKVTVEDFPNEVLTHIFSHLPPATLMDISLVCRRFHALMTSPHAWRTAFSRFFVGPASLRTDVGSEEYDQLLSQRRSFSRVSPIASWRNEYILRSQLLRALSRGKPNELQPPASPRPSLRRTLPTNINALTTYRSHIFHPITHLDASFTTASGQKQAQFIHGAQLEGLATTSDPLNGKFGIDPWGDNVSEGRIFRHYWRESLEAFNDVVGVPNSMDTSQQFGYVYGEGVPGGRVYYQSTTEKSGLWLAGWDSSGSDEFADPDARAGIPNMSLVKNVNSITSVWITKNTNIPRLSHGLIGILVGSSTGILAAYSLGPSPHYSRKFSKGQLTAKWALCPGVPIINISIDGQYSESRQQNGRVWAVVTNALGEVFYLRDMPTPLPAPLVRGRNRLDMTQPDLASADRDAWLTGRTVEWHLVAPTRRAIRPDAVGIYSYDIDATPESTPRSSCISQNLSTPQIAAETSEMQKWLILSWRKISEMYNDWDMDRRVVVDFAGGSVLNEGENVVVTTRKSDGWTDEPAEIRRYSRFRVSDPSQKVDDVPTETTKPTSSLFGGPVTKDAPSNDSLSSENTNYLFHNGDAGYKDEWRVTDLDYTEGRLIITALALDCSTFATSTVDEDPAVTRPCGKDSQASSPPASTTISTPVTPATPTTHSPAIPIITNQSHTGRSATEIPGQRGRYLAIGTNSGKIVVFDVRAHPNHRSDHANTITPISVIQTESPAIACVALTSLYLVHGGIDGLVQAWDPLVSSTKPIRTLNSRFASRARKHLRRAEDALEIVDTNWYSAGAIALDPDATSLVGLVALGSHLRFWSYSSAGADGFKGTKRRNRLGTARHAHIPGSGDGGMGQMRFKNGMRGYIASEEHDMRVDAEEREKENKILSSRFGVDLLGPGASEEEILAYARLLSEEAHERERQREQAREQEAVEQGKGKIVVHEEAKRNDDDEGAWEEIPPELLQEEPISSSAYMSGHQTPAFASGSGQIQSESADDEEVDAELAEALRLSLLDAERDTTPAYNALDYEPQQPSASLDAYNSHAQVGSSSAAAASSSTKSPTDKAPVVNQTTEEMDPDLAYAIQLSIAEEESRKAAQMTSQGHDVHEDWASDQQQHQWNISEDEEEDNAEFPALGGSAKNKGKGKAKGKGRGW